MCLRLKKKLPLSCSIIHLSSCAYWIVSYKMLTIFKLRRFETLNSYNCLTENNEKLHNVNVSFVDNSHVSYYGLEKIIIGFLG